MSEATPLATIHKALAVVWRKAGFRDRVPIRPFIWDCVVNKNSGNRSKSNQSKGMGDQGDSHR